MRPSGGSETPLQNVVVVCLWLLMFVCDVCGAYVWLSTDLRVPLEVIWLTVGSPQLQILFTVLFQFSMLVKVCVRGFSVCCILCELVHGL